MLLATDAPQRQTACAFTTLFLSCYWASMAWAGGFVLNHSSFIKHTHICRKEQRGVRMYRLGCWLYLHHPMFGISCGTSCLVHQACTQALTRPNMVEHMHTGLLLVIPAAFLIHQELTIALPSGCPRMSHRPSITRSHFCGVFQVDCLGICVEWACTDWVARRPQRHAVLPT